MVTIDVVELENVYAGDINNTYTQNGKYKEKLRKIVFQNQMAPYENADEVVDFSEVQDASVLGYYVKNNPVDENSTYTLYIQADGKIKVNPIASYYGYIKLSMSVEIMVMLVIM